MGACSAGRQGRAVGRVRAGRISANIPVSIPDPMLNPIPFFKIDHFALLAKEMSIMGTILKEMAVFLKLNVSRVADFLNGFYLHKEFRAAEI